MNTNVNDTLSRMKSLMNYGLQTEGKKDQYSSVEYQKLGADGNYYGIVREGSKYYIKKAPNKKNLVREDYQYIGGFRNRKENEYSNYALAQKQFDLKMMSIKESCENPSFDVESWDLNKKENVVVEASEKMRNEILRERQIMKNAMSINEKKAVCCDAPTVCKDNIKKEKPETGNAEDAVDHEKAELPKEMTEEVVKEEEVLGWNRDNDDYMDKSHGTEIGDSAPFDDAEAKNIDGDKKVTKTGEMKNGVVENHNQSMHDAESQDTPTVGVGEGPSDDNNAPFDDEKGKQIDEAIEDFGDEEDVDVDTEVDDEGFGSEGLGADGGEEFVSDDDFGTDDDFDEEDDDFDEEDDDDVFEDDLESRVEAMEDVLNKIAVKLGVDDTLTDDGTYDDDELYDDEVSDVEYDDMPMESRRRGGVEIYESAGYRRAMNKFLNEDGMTPFTDANRVPRGNMNKLNDFGKHPAYQKRVMTTPPKDFQEFDGYYDMNDESVRNDEPYGKRIGDGAPFEIDTETIDNAIAEAMKRLKKKI